MYIGVPLVEIKTIVCRVANENYCDYSQRAGPNTIHVQPYKRNTGPTKEFVEAFAEKLEAEFKKLNIYDDVVIAVQGKIVEPSEFGEDTLSEKAYFITLRTL